VVSPPIAAAYNFDIPAVAISVSNSPSASGVAIPSLDAAHSGASLAASPDVLLSSPYGTIEGNSEVIHDHYKLRYFHVHLPPLLPFPTSQYMWHHYVDVLCFQ
jgi:hypothetical protein